MEDLSIGEGLFEEDGETKQSRRDKRIAERKRDAAGYEPRIDTPERLDFDAGYVEKWLAEAVGDVPSHELRRLEAVCSHLYYNSRYDDCLRSAVALMRWQAGLTESLQTSDEQLADLAMRSSLKSKIDDAAALGLEVAAASRHLWPVYAGLAISAARCFERGDKLQDANKAYAAYLLIRGTNKSISQALLVLLRRAHPELSMEPDPQTLARLLSLNLPEAERLSSLMKRSVQLETTSVDGEEQAATGGGRHDRSVRTL